MTLPVKVPPSDVEAEQALLCCCLLDQNLIGQVKSLLEPVGFYRDAHRVIFDGMGRLGTLADVVTLSEFLRSQGVLDKAGGPDYLFALSETVSTSAAWKYHLDTILEASRRRKVINACSIAVDGCFEQIIDFPETVSSLKQSLTEIDRNQNPEIESSLSIVQKVFKDIEERRGSKDNFVGLKTGLSNIDNALFGLEPGTSTYLIARPSIGKTALALTIADYVADNQGPVLFFSLESNRYALTRRRLSARSKVFLSRIRTGDIEDGQWEHLTKACEQLVDCPLMIVDNSRYKDPETLSSFTETVNLKTPLKLIVVDHIQLMRPRRSGQSRHHEISQAADTLQALAKNCGVPVIILCQLSRDIEKRIDKTKKRYPQLSDMKESGDLEQNADNVWGLWRWTKESEDARLEQLKGRDTGTWTVWLKFDRFTQRFIDGGGEPEEEKERKDIDV